MKEKYHKSAETKCIESYACERKRRTFELLMALHVNVEGALFLFNNSHASLFMAFCSFLKHSLKVRRRPSNYFWQN